MSSNKKCTRPGRLARTVDTLPNVTIWVVFLYAEQGYSAALGKALEKAGRTVVFEDQMQLNPLEDGDNYFAWLVAEEVMGRARVVVDTHVCRGRPEPSVQWHRQFGSSVQGRVPQPFERDADAFDYQARGICQQ